MIDTLQNLDPELETTFLTKKNIVDALTISDIVFFLESLGVSNYEVNEEKGQIICPTICHNALNEEASMKLYWYQDHKMFRCYTECNEAMSIFTLYKKFMSINYHPVSDEEAMLYVRSCIKHVVFAAEPISQSMKFDLSKYDIDNNIPAFKVYPKELLSYFTKYYHPSWLREGITKEVMDKFHIGFSIIQNKIIIPHFDLYGNLIGIRARTLNPEELELTKMKYGPIKIGDTLYSHPLQFNLYGAYQHQQGIRLRKSAIIAEAEKSVLLDDVYYGALSNTVACCGLTFNKYHINILVDKLGVNEIVVALDKEYNMWYDEKAKAFRARILKMCNTYKHKVSFSYIWDFDNVLQEKDSPFDKGKEVFEHLYKTRVKVR